VGLVGKTEGLRKARGAAMEPTNQREAGKEVAKLSQVIQIDEGKIQEHLGEVVRSTVEEAIFSARARLYRTFLG